MCIRDRTTDGFETRAIHERHDDFANTSLNLKRNFVEAVLNLRASIAGFSIVEHEVIEPTDGLFEHHLTVDHDYDGRGVLKTARVKTQRSIGEMHFEPIFAVRCEIVFEPEAAISKSERHRLSTAIIVESVHRVVEARIAHSLFRDHARGLNVLLD